MKTSLSEFPTEISWINWASPWPQIQVYLSTWDACSKIERACIENSYIYTFTLCDHNEYTFIDISYLKSLIQLPSIIFIQEISSIIFQSAHYNFFSTHRYSVICNFIINSYLFFRNKIIITIIIIYNNIIFIIFYLVELSLNKIFTLFNF